MCDCRECTRRCFPPDIFRTDGKRESYYVPPELLRLDDLAVRIPRLEIVALQRIAVRDGRSVDAVLARELRDLVSAESSWLCREIPGFAQALNWP
jgi:hypothetical protein